MYKIEYTTRFRQDLKRIAKRSQDDFNELEVFVEHLCESGFHGIDAKYKPHYLKGKFARHCECHVKNDLLLIWHEKKQP
jgi:mRNA interferase YafQ